MLVPIVINSQNKEEVKFIETVLQDIVKQLDINDFKYLKESNIDLKKLIEAAKNNPLIAKIYTKQKKQ